MSEPAKKKSRLSHRAEGGPEELTAEFLEEEDHEPQRHRLVQVRLQPDSARDTKSYGRARHKLSSRDSGESVPAAKLQSRHRVVRCFRLALLLGRR